jgi:hypothetical protein
VRGQGQCGPNVMGHGPGVNPNQGMSSSNPRPPQSTHSHSLHSPLPHIIASWLSQLDEGLRLPTHFLIPPSPLPLQQPSVPPRSYQSRNTLDRVPSTLMISALGGCFREHP